MKRRLIYGLFVIGILTMLSGCVKGDFHVTVNQNGTSDLDYKIGMNAQLAGLIAGNGQQDPIEEMKTSFTKQGFTVSQYRDGDYVGVEAKRHLDSLKDIGNSLPSQNLLGQDNDPQANPSKLNFTADKGLFFTTYRYSGTLDMTSMKPDKNDTMGIQQMMLKQVDLKLTLTLPVKANEQNASRILSDQKTYQWDLIPGTKGDITLQAKVPNVTNIIIGIIVLIVILVGVTFAIVKSRRRVKRSNDPVDELPIQ